MKISTDPVTHECFPEYSQAELAARYIVKGYPLKRLSRERLMILSIRLDLARMGVERKLDLSETSVLRTNNEVLGRERALTAAADERNHTLMRLGESLETEKEWIAMCGTVGAERDTLSTELSMTQAALRISRVRVRKWLTVANFMTVVAILAGLSHLIFH